MKKLFALALCCAAAAAQAQPAKQTYLHIPSAEQKLKPDGSGLYSQMNLSRQDKAIALISERDKSGQAEMHADWNDHMFIQQGEATMTLGGTIQNPRQTAKGETRGDAITGGKTISLHAGDYVFVPVNVPHRMVLAPGKTIRYAVVKTQP